MRTIALEEHLNFPNLTKRIDPAMMEARGWPPGFSKNPTQIEAQALLPEVGEARLKSMDENQIDIQVLSLAGPGADLLPPRESVTFAKEVNDNIAKKVAENPTRFSAFAHLPMTSSEGSADELERAVTELKFCGAMINGTTGGAFLDDPRFALVLARAEKLKVPLYLHPNFPSLAIQKLYYQGLPKAVAPILASAGFGWHVETGLHILRLVTSGTLERFPRLQIIIGHMGETLPFMMARADTVLPKSVTGLERTVGETLRTQVNLTTSGFFTLPPFLNALDTFGVDRILFSVDYPFSKNDDARKFLDSLPLKPDELEKVAGGNAAKLLKLF